MKLGWKSWIGLAGLLVGLSLVAAGQRGTPARSITVAELREHVGFLASDAMRGRETGEAGVRRAEAYIAESFKRAGLRPLPGREGYFVDFPLYRSSFDGQATTLTLRSGETIASGRLGEDFRPFPFTDEGDFEGPVVFAGYGITAPEHDYDDYARLDVEGKIVLILRHEPAEDDPESIFDGSASSTHALFESKARNAREHGARAMLLVTDPLHHGPSDDLRVGAGLRLDPPEAREGPRSTEQEPPFLAVQISRALAETLAGSGPGGLEKLQRHVDSGAQAADSALGQARASVGVRRTNEVEKVAASNVAGFLEGRDERLKHEWIVIGGHHDHIGAFHGEGDVVFNGADDNASGTAGVLELAQAFAGRSERPRRSLLFVTFTGEEKGLLGSRALLRDERIPVEKLVFMLNLDMIGRNPDRDIQVVGDGFVRGLREIVETANARYRLPLEFSGSSYSGNSDHDSFYERDVPFMFFFSGVHEDYHQLGDHVEKLEYRRMQTILRLAHDVVDRLARSDTRPGFVHHVGWLGIRAEVLEGDDGTRSAVVTKVDEGSRASASGLLQGDVLAGFGDRVLEDADRLGEHFREVEPGTRLALAVLRGGRPRTIEIERARTGYLGVFPGPVDPDRRDALGLGSDEGIVLRRVVAEGPAAIAGLEEGDLLLRIEGRPVGTSSLGSRLSQIGAGETVRVQLLRDGERLELPLTLGERPRR